MCEEKRRDEEEHCKCTCQILKFSEVENVSILHFNVIKRTFMDYFISCSENETHLHLLIAYIVTKPCKKLRNP